MSGGLLADGRDQEVKEIFVPTGLVVGVLQTKKMGIFKVDLPESRLLLHCFAFQHCHYAKILLSA